MSRISRRRSSFSFSSSSASARLVPALSALALALALALLAGAGGCRREDGPAPRSLVTATPLFTDDFESGSMAAWTALAGTWEIVQPAGASKELATTTTAESVAQAGLATWADYRLSADVRPADVNGGVALLARVQANGDFYQLELKRDPASGERRWWIWKRQGWAWSPLASGPFAWAAGTQYRLRFDLVGPRLTASVSTDFGVSFATLGMAEDATFRAGRIGLRTWGTLARFDVVEVVDLSDDGTVWGANVSLRDDSDRWPEHKPDGGWWVTPVHATLLPSGKVLVTGWGRRDEKNCLAGHGRMNGTSFVLDPAAVDAAAGTLNVTPLDEAGAPADDKLYCAGHVTAADGRILYTGGSRYTGLGTSAEVELGLDYARLFDPTTTTFTRVSAPMQGGPAGWEGVRWYPTNTLLPDGRVLVTSGFTKCCGTWLANRSIEVFDPVALAPGSASSSPWTVLVPHASGPSAVGPDTLDYTIVTALQAPVSAAGRSRELALFGGEGRVLLFSAAAGIPAADRFASPANGARPDAPAQAGAGASGARIADGRLAIVGGTASGAVARRLDLYAPADDAWTSVDLGISRFHGSTVLLPDGTLFLANGFASGSGYVGDRRRPQIVDPVTSTVTTLAAWPDDPLERGYHSFALLLRDGRVLLGGGTASGHGIGCERPDVRIVSPPYLARGPRPVLEAPTTPITFEVGGPPVALPAPTEPLREGRPAVVLMAPGSVTHNFDQGQRIVPLGHEIVTTAAGGELRIAPPATVQAAPPGIYLLYVVSARGVPSVGVPVQVLPPG
jgi:hypothetical protein